MNIKVWQVKTYTGTCAGGRGGSARAASISCSGSAFRAGAGLRLRDGLSLSG